MAKKSNSSATPSAFVTYSCAAAITLLGGGLVAGLFFGTGALEERAAAALDRGETAVRIEWPVAAGGTGTWMPRASSEQLLAVAKEAAGSSLDSLSADQVVRVATAMAESGWFVGTPRVARVAGGEIVVDGTWRIPAANVRHQGSEYLISWDGSPMPPGVQAGKWIFDPALGPPRDGAGERDYVQPWAGEDVAASLELLGRIAPEPWSKQVRGVDASEYASKGTLVIVTDRDTRVVWGGRPSKPAMGEVSTAQKIEHLRQLVKDTKRIDATYPLIYVNQERLLFDISAAAQALRAAAEAETVTDDAAAR
jgi:hypothetical protein